MVAFLFSDIAYIMIWQLFRQMLPLVLAGRQPFKLLKMMVKTTQRGKSCILGDPLYGHVLIIGIDQIFFHLLQPEL